MPAGALRPSPFHPINKREISAEPEPRCSFIECGLRKEEQVFRVGVGVKRDDNLRA